MAAHNNHKSLYHRLEATLTHILSLASIDPNPFLISCLLARSRFGHVQIQTLYITACALDTSQSQSSILQTKPWLCFFQGSDLRYLVHGHTLTGNLSENQPESLHVTMLLRPLHKRSTLAVTRLVGLGMRPKFLFFFPQVLKAHHFLSRFKTPSHPNSFQRIEILQKKKKGLLSSSFFLVSITKTQEEVKYQKKWHLKWLGDQISMDRTLKHY